MAASSMRAAIGGRVLWIMKTEGGGAGVGGRGEGCDADSGILGSTRCFQTVEITQSDGR